MSKFQVDETVMAEDKGNIYVAKIVKFAQIPDAKGDSAFQYFIHYQGWARKFDAWVQADQICKADDEDAKIQLQLYSLSKNPSVPKPPGAAKEGKRGRSSRSDPLEGLLSELGGGEDEDGNAPLKRKSNAELEEEARELKRNRAMLSNSDLLQEDDADMSTAQRLEIPLVLKKHLLDEWTLISQQDPRRLLKLPRKISAEQALKDFVQSLEDKLDDDQYEHQRDFFEGLQLYFEKALPTILLYRHERDQYNLVLEKCPDALPSQIYGPEHLLRLFVRLPKLLSGVFLPPSEVNKVFTKLTQFLKFLAKNSGRYLIPEDYVLEDDAMIIDSEAASAFSASSSSSSSEAAAAAAAV